jgi:FMN phosphatase YigB (HAD superfamily)
MSLGYVPPVPRLKLPARRGNPWVLAPWNDSAMMDSHGSQKGGRRGLILDLDAISLHEGVVEALQQLRVAGWQLAILTNGLPSVQFRTIAALQLTTLVDEIVYAEEHVSEGKPAAAAFNAVLRSLDLSARQCICVGDDLLRGARALGMRTIRIARAGGATAGADDADIVVGSIRELPNAALLLSDTVTADVA